MPSTSGANAFKGLLSRAIETAKRVGAKRFHAEGTKDKFSIDIDLTDETMPTNNETRNPWDEVYEEDPKRPA